VEHQKDVGTYVDPNLGKVPLSAFWEHFIRTSPPPAESTRALYAMQARTYILPRLGHVPLHAITRPMVKSFLADLHEQGVKDPSINGAYRLLRRVLAVAVEEGRITQNPAARIQAPKSVPREMNFLSAKEVDALSRAVDERYETLILFLAFTGTRIGEAAALRMKNVDLLKRQVTIVEASKEVEGKLYLGPTKNRRNRSVTLPSFLSEGLARHVERFSSPEDPEALVFPGPSGGVLRQTAFRNRVFRPAATKLGIVAFQMSAETHARVANAAAEAAKAKGWSVTVLNSRGAAPDHAAQVADLIRGGVDGIILAMGKVQQLEAELQEAQKKGIAVITVSSGTGKYTLFDVNADEFVVGAKIATYLLGRLNYQGNILMQRYEQHVGTRIRGKVMDIELSENTGVKLLATHTMARSASWQDDVRKGMEALLLKHKGEVNAIWASFDGQAFIIDDILQQMGFKKGQVLLTGVDGGKEAYKRIRNPESLFTATIDIPYEKMAREAVDAMEKIVVKKLKRTDVVQGPFLFVEPVLIDSTNVPRE